MKIIERAITSIVAVALVAAVGGCGMDDMMPNPPSDLMAQELSGGAHLTWKDNSDNEAGFMVERKVGAGAFETLANVPFDTTQFHDAPLTSGTPYGYRVMAMPKQGGHDTGTTEYSNEVTFTAP
jgi:hypothetical protein